jgi:hypothetical protein
MCSSDALIVPAIILKGNNQTKLGQRPAWVCHISKAFRVWRDPSSLPTIGVWEVADLPVREKNGAVWPGLCLHHSLLPRPTFLPQPVEAL